MRQVSRPHFAKIEAQQQFALLIGQGLVDRKVAKIKENVAHAGILPIEDPDSATIVNEIAGKQVIMAKDTPGFIVNRLLIPYLLISIAAFENGVATREDIDAGMVLGCGLPMGPLTLSDFIGLDTVLFIADAMFEEMKDPSLAAPPLLRRMVTAGYLGRKSGRGFYEYT